MIKVSLISPCYNGETYLTHFLDSLLLQTYQNVEFIFVNDGSTDKTEDIFMSYKTKLETKGWSVIYIHQENNGQASALNQGLKIFTGDYLIFPDSDDILYPNHISQKVEFMEQHPELGFAFCKLDAVDETDINQIKYQMFRKQTTNDNLDLDLINRNNILWTPIGNIFRRSDFLKAHPSKRIYEGTGGQNFQMLFPMACHSKYGYIDSSLGKYVIRKESHSRLKKSKEDRDYELIDIWLNTIKNLTNINNQTKLLYIKTTFNHYFNLHHPHTSTTLPRIKIKPKTILKPFIKIKEHNKKYKIYLFGIHLLTIWK